MNLDDLLSLVEDTPRRSSGTRLFNVSGRRAGNAFRSAGPDPRRAEKRRESERAKKKKKKARNKRLTKLKGLSRSNPMTALLSMNSKPAQSTYLPTTLVDRFAYRPSPTPLMSNVPASGLDLLRR